MTELTTETKQLCCICGNRYEGMGNNPEPLGTVEQRCCNLCNGTRVLPARGLHLDKPRVQHCWKGVDAPVCGSKDAAWLATSAEESESVPVCAVCHRAVMHERYEQIKRLEAYTQVLAAAVDLLLGGAGE